MRIIIKSALLSLNKCNVCDFKNHKRCMTMLLYSVALETAVYSLNPVEGAKLNVKSPRLVCSIISRLIAPQQH